MITHNTLKLLVILMLPVTGLGQANFIFPINDEVVLANANGVMNTGNFVVDYNGQPLMAHCWDGGLAKFNVTWGGTQITQTLLGNNLGFVQNPDIIIDPRGGATVNVIICYTVDPQNTSPRRVYYEAWSFDGTTLTNALTPTTVTSNTNEEYESNIDVSVDGKAAIVFNDGYNTEIIAIPDVSAPTIATQNTLVDLPCIFNCYSKFADVAVKSKPSTNEAVVSVSFIDHENLPNRVFVHSFDYALIGGSINCGVLDSIYMSSGPDHHLGYPRIDGPDICENNSNSHLNDFIVVHDAIEDWDLSSQWFIFSHTKKLNSTPQMEYLTSNRYPGGQYPSQWPFVNMLSSNNPYTIGDVVNGNTFDFELITCYNYLPVVAYSDEFNIVAWNYNAFTPNPNSHCAHNVIENNSQMQNNYIGNSYINIVARQLDDYGVVENPGVSKVDDIPAADQYLANNHLISISSKFEPNHEVLYTWFDESQSEIVYKRIPNVATQLKSDFKNASSDVGLSQSQILTLDQLSSHTIRVVSRLSETNVISFEVISANGGLIAVFNSPISVGSQNIDLHELGLKPGFYLVQVRTENNSIIAKTKLVVLR